METVAYLWLRLLLLALVIAVWVAGLTRQKGVLATVVANVENVRAVTQSFMVASTACAGAAARGASSFPSGFVECTLEVDLESGTAVDCLRRVVVALEGSNQPEAVRDVRERADALEEVLTGEHGAGAVLLRARAAAQATGEMARAYQNMTMHALTNGVLSGLMMVVVVAMMLFA